MADDFQQSFNAKDWAKAFVERVRKNPSIATDEGCMIGWFANAIMRGFDEHAEITVSPSEALYGFAAFLTCRPGTLTVGAKHNAAPMANLVRDYCEVQEFREPRDGWTDRLKVMPEARGEKEVEDE